MKPRPAILLAAALVGTVACASVIGLDGYDIDDGVPDSSVTDGPAALDADTTDAGALSVGEVTIAPDTLTISDARCDVAKSGTFTLTNTKDSAVTFEITLPPNDSFVLEGASNGILTGSLAAKETRSIKVTGKSATGEVRGTDLQIKVGEAVLPYSVKLLVGGAQLAISPPSLDFGDIRSNTTANATVFFKNPGTDAITITGFGDAGTNFTIPAAALIVPGGGETQAEITMTAAEAGAPVTAIMTPTLNGALCGPIPSLEVTGHRVDQETTVNPVTLDFGTQNCGTTPTTSLKVTISNYRISSAATFTTSLTSSTFKVTPTSGTVPAATGTTPGKLELAVTLVDTNGKPGDRNENLAVNITTAPVTTTQVKLHVKTSGALVQLSSPSVTLPPGKITVNAGITNVGNVTVCVHYDENSINDRFFGVEADRGDTLEPNVLGDIDVAYDERGQYPGAPTSGPEPRTAPVTITAVSCGNSLPVPPLCGPMPTLTLMGP